MFAYAFQATPSIAENKVFVFQDYAFSIQRITQARIASEKEDRDVRDGEIKTACEQVCPTGAITFGDINNPNSAVRKIKDGPRNYQLLAELNTRPRTTYVAAVRNPNPKLASGTEKT